MDVGARLEGEAVFATCARERTKMTVRSYNGGGRDRQCDHTLPGVEWCLLPQHPSARGGGLSEWSWFL